MSASAVNVRYVLIVEPRHYQWPEILHNEIHFHERERKVAHSKP